MWEFSISAPQAKKLSVFDLKIKEIGGLGFGFRGSGGAPVPRHLAELGNFSKDFGKSTPGPSLLVTAIAAPAGAVCSIC